MGLGAVLARLEGLAGEIEKFVSLDSGADALGAALDAARASWTAQIALQLNILAQTLLTDLEG